MSSIAIIDAPSNLGLAPLFPGHHPGTRGAPDALRALGLHEALGAQVQRRVEAAPYRPDDHRSINVRNMEAIALHAVQLADAIEEERRAGRFVLVIGGDCSLLLGAMLANARLGQAGLLFIDGHTDFYLPEQSGTGGAAGMDLALVAGWGPEALVDLEGRRPLVDPGRVAALGNRDFEPRTTAGLPAIEQALGCYLPLPEMRRLGMQEAMQSALQAASPGAAPYWIHLDVDVLDGAIMPAVDSPQRDGLSAAELEQ
ncbi:MAG: arginase family protein, partial [Devosia sp.]